MLSVFNNFAAACTPGNFLTFNHTWYSYLPSTNINGVCTPQISSLTDLWLIVAAIIEILLRVAALAAIGFIIYGGFTYLTSQGEPDKTSKGRSTLTNALVGLVLAIMSATIINFIASSFK